MSTKLSKATEPDTDREGWFSTMIDALAKAPIWIIAAMLILGGLLMGLQTFWIMAIQASGGEEPPQWLARITVMQVNVLVPLALVMLWTRRRRAQGALGAIGAAMLAVLPILHVFLTCAAILWGGILGRGDMVYPFMYVEYLMFVSIAGVFVSGVAWMLDREASRWVGPLIIAGLLLGYVFPGGMLVGYIALSVVLLTRGIMRGRPGARRVMDAASRLEQ